MSVFCLNCQISLFQEIFSCKIVFIGILRWRLTIVCFDLTYNLLTASVRGNIFLCVFRTRRLIIMKLYIQLFPVLRFCIDQSGDSVGEEVRTILLCHWPTSAYVDQRYMRVLSWYNISRAFCQYGIKSDL